MPQVPVTSPEIESRPATPVYQTDTSNVSGIGNSGQSVLQAAQRLGRFSDDIAQLALKQQIDTATRQAKNADNEYSAYLRTLGFGDGTPENLGFFSLAGENAINSRKDVLDQAAKKRKEIEGRLGIQARDMFSSSANSRDDTFFGNVSSHTVKATEEANKLTSVSRIEEAKQNFAANYNSTKVRAQSEAIILAELSEVYKGQAPEVIKNALEEERSKMFVMAIDRALLSDISAAKELYSANRVMIDANAQTVIETNIKQAENAARVQDEHNAAMARLNAGIAADEAMDSYVNQFILNGTFDLTQVANDPNLAGDPSKKITLLGMMEAATKGASRSDVSAATSAKLYDGIMAGAIVDETPFNLAYASGMLTVEHLKFLRETLADSATPDGQRLSKTKETFFKDIASSITSSTVNLLDAPGDEALFRYKQYVENILIEARKKGEDPHEYFDETSPKYLGRQSLLDQFAPSVNQEVDAFFGRMNSAPNITKQNTSTVDISKVKEAFLAGELKSNEVIVLINAELEAGRINRETAMEWAREVGVAE